MSTTSTITTTERRQKHTSLVIEGTLSARIIPKDFQEYERLKPGKRKLSNPAIWRQRIQWPAVEPTLESSPAGDSSPQALNDPIVVLEIELKIPPLLNNSETNRSQTRHSSSKVGLQRAPEETAVRTLRRLELSLQKRLDSIFDPRYRRAPQGRESSVSPIIMEDLRSTILVLSDSSLNQWEGFRCTWGGYEEFFDGYSRLDIQDDFQNEALWLDLSQRSSSRLWIDSPTENVSGIALKLDPCPPTLLMVRNFDDFTANVFVGVPLVLETTVVHAMGALVVWFVDKEQVCFDSHSYTPKTADCGKKITVLISPIRHDQRHGPDEVYEFASLVRERPDLPILALRSSWLPRDVTSREQTLRVLSYNLMADIHLSPEVYRRAEYADCDPALLSRPRRIPLLLHEILRHDADIVCLQEVDATIYEALLRPAMTAHGFAGVFANKATEQLEGSAIFWSLKTFQKDAEYEAYPIRDLFRLPKNLDEDWDSMDKIRSFLRVVPDLRQVVEERVGQILQVVRLKSKNSSKRLVVGNTHLFYHPLADHVRLMQIFVSCKMLDNWCRRDFGSDRDQLIFCGDLNSDPTSGAFKLLVDRNVTPSLCDAWKNLDKYTWESSESEPDPDQGEGRVGCSLDPLLPLQTLVFDRPTILNPPVIELPKSFPRLLSAYDPLPSFTNYVMGFRKTLDYIFVSETNETARWRVGNPAPVPTEQDMRCPAIPNGMYPSDHISIACDFKRDDSDPLQDGFLFEKGAP